MHSFSIQSDPGELGYYLDIDGTQCGMVEAHLIAIRAWPNDEGAKRAFMQAYYRMVMVEIEAAGKNKGAAVISDEEGRVLAAMHDHLGGWKAFSESPSNSEVMKDLTSRAGLGAIAGVVLLLIHSIATATPELAGKASVNKVIHLMEMHGAELFGRRFERNDVLPAWSQFRDVAHLWAAEIYMESFFPEEILAAEAKEPKNEANSTHRLLRKLVHARNFQTFGLSFKPKSSPKMLLDIESTWCIGSLPWEYEETMPIVIDPKILGSLEDYQAPKSIPKTRHPYRTA